MRTRRLMLAETLAYAALVVGCRQVKTSPAETWDPFADCPRFTPKLNPAEAQSWLAAVAVIATLADAYANIKNSSNDYSKLLESIDGQLTEIREKLNVVNTKLDTIILLLSRLPDIVRGEMQKVQIESYLAVADIKIGQIKDRLQPKVIERELDTINQLTISLAQDLGPAMRFGGIAATFVIAPYLATWLSARVAYQKTKRKLDKDWVILSPWEESIMADNASLFAKLFANTREEEKKLAIDISQMPPHEHELKLEAGRLVPKRIILYEAYKLQCPNGAADPDVAVDRLFFRDLPRDSFVEVPDSSTVHAAAVKAHQKLKKRRSEALAFFQYEKPILEQENNLNQVFKEPDEIWASEGSKRQLRTVYVFQIMEENFDIVVVNETAGPDGWRTRTTGTCLAIEDGSVQSSANQLICHTGLPHNNPVITLQGATWNSPVGARGTAEINGGCGGVATWKLISRD